MGPKKTGWSCWLVGCTHKHNHCKSHEVILMYCPIQGPVMKRQSGWAVAYVKSRCAPLDYHKKY